MNIDYKRSPNFTKGRNGWKPDMIVCHITDGNYSGAVSWLCNTQSQASAHFVVSRKGDISQLVNLEDTAWCNGTSLSSSDKRFYGNSTLKAVKDRKTNANSYTVGIETEGFSETTKGALTDIQQEAVVNLIKHIISEVKSIYGICIPLDRQHIIGHYEITPITKPNCPGIKFPFDDIIENLKGDVEMIEKSKFKINGTIYDMDRILKDNTNYLKVADLKKAGFDVNYDKANNLPIINSPKS